jgi:hypothetical protein
MKRLLIIFVGGLLLISGVSRYLARRPDAPVVTEVKVRKKSPKIELLPPVILDSAASASAPSVRSPKKRPGDNSITPSSAPSGATNTAQANAPNGSKSPLKDPIARLALSDVGLDSDAEEYWLMAINDPTLSANERQDLIEDLNEEGFDDPKNLTVDDLPLIMSRIALIEEYGPLAMDEVNAAAFDEAYKDLLEMFDKVTRP